MFLTKIPGLYHYGHRKAITLDPTVWRFLDGSELIIPRGFPTDGASIPYFWQWRRSPFNPAYLRSAVVHDFGYLLLKVRRSEKTRPVIDREFYHMMVSEGFYRADTFYRAVRFAGWWPAYFGRVRREDLHWLRIMHCDSALDCFISDVRAGKYGGEIKEAS